MHGLKEIGVLGVEVPHSEIFNGNFEIGSRKIIDIDIHALIHGDNMIICLGNNDAISKSFRTKGILVKTQSNNTECS